LGDGRPWVTAKDVKQKSRMIVTDKPQQR